jgi:2-hydroxy-6-oxonona-2,4-dienedioate hydrolase
MGSMFKSEAARAEVVAWFERFHARLSAPTERRRVMTRFGEAHVLVGGPETAPPLVLLHGAMATSAHALAELEGLLQAFRVYAVDVVGQSVMSADQRPSVKDDAYGHWLAEVLDGLSLPTAHLVGVSWGGFVAQRLAAVAPERITRLALLVPAGLVSGPFFEGFRRVGWPMTLYLFRPSEANLDKFVANLLTTKDDDWRRFLGDAFRAYDMSGMKVPRLARDGEFAKLTAPVLVIGADRDASFPGPMLLERARKLFPSLADTELLKDSNHCPPTTPEFRAWLSDRLVRFFAAE